MMRFSSISFALLFIVLTGCQSSPKDVKDTVDLIMFNAWIYPVEGSPVPNGAVVIDNGKIVAVGSTTAILDEWVDKTVASYDCHGAFLMPGFIEGHGHFRGLGEILLELDLLDTKSWQEITDSVAMRVKNAVPGEWIVGRGWHQEKWTQEPMPGVNGYPYHHQLSTISPDNPVILIHASGHALFANDAAMKAAGITSESQDPPGGRIVRDASGNILGIFEENAMNAIAEVWQENRNRRPVEYRRQQWTLAIQKAQDHCLQKGITSFQDAGSSFEEINRYKTMADQDELNLRLWVMLRHPFDTLRQPGKLDGLPIIGAGRDMFTCRAIKSELDGALGSFGAWLLQPYHDKPGFTGQNTTTVYEVKGIADLCMAHNLQLCVHAIGDRANRVVIDIYEGVMQAHPDKQDLRWRVEHAQHLDPDDIPRFKANGIIASMQGIHCTSDAPFVVRRLGETRARQGAYAWRSLLDAGVIIANGTDAPVERVDPLPNLYASVTRKRLQDGQVFFPEQSMTREEALYSYTLGNAFAGFEENIKGSIVPGKWADIILVSQNLLECPEDSIPAAHVLLTMVGGEIKYQR